MLLSTTTSVSGDDTTPPVTIPTIEGFLYMGGSYVGGPVDITLNATDDASGVNYTMYKLDDGNWTMYAQPFKVHKWGSYILYYYSVDTVGNFEEIKNVSFSLKLSPVDIIFTPGLYVGIRATIRHNATDVLSDFECHYILINEFGLLLSGESHQMSIDTLAPGESITMYDFPFGFCFCSHISVSIVIPSQLKGFTYGVNNKLIILGPITYLK